MWYNSRVKVLYGFPQRLEITVDAPSLTEAETEEPLALTASLLREEDFAADFEPALQPPLRQAGRLPCVGGAGRAHGPGQRVGAAPHGRYGAAAQLLQRVSL